MAGEQQRKFEDRIIAAVEKAEIAHELLTLSTNSKRTLFLLLQKLSEQLGFIDDPRGWLDSPEKRQEAARSRVVGGVDLLTNQPIQNEQELHAVWASTNDPETIDLIGRAATGKLLVGAFRFIVEVYFRTWSKTPDSHYENFAESVGIIKSLVIAECRALWSGRLLAPSDMNPPASEELPWFDLMPRADVAAELEDEADRRSNQAREVELTRRAEVAEPVSSESIATELHHKAEAKNERLWHTWVMKPRRIALYARVSTKDKGQDTRNQQNQLRTYAAKQEWEIVAEYVDVRASPGTGHSSRP